MWFRKGVEPRKIWWVSADGFVLRQATTGTAPRRAVPVLPGVLGHIEPDIENAR